MRSDVQERLALAHVAPHKTEVEELQVAQSAVDESRGPGAGAGAEVVLLDERDGEPAERGVTRDARPDDPATDDQEIDGAVAERPHRLLAWHAAVARRPHHPLACSYLFALLYLSIWSFMSAT